MLALSIADASKYGLADGSESCYAVKEKRS